MENKKTIICSIQPFILNQTINLYDPETKTVSVFNTSDMLNLSSNLYSAALTNNAEEIQVYGEKKYTKRIAEELTQLYKNNIYNKKVRVYLNGQICD